MSVSKKNSVASDECAPTKRRRGRAARVFGRYMPVILWLPRYTKLQAISDFVAGITLGLTMIPQSIAYAALAGLNAQYGLYSSFIGGFVYVLFGTVKEVSIGPTSLMALLTLEYTRDMPVDFIILLAFIAGCVELMMGVLNLGFLVDFISIPVTSGFTSATSVIIIIAQLQGLLGLKYKSSNIVDNLVQLFRRISSVRYSDLILGVSCIVFLLTFRKLKDIRCGGPTKKILWLLSISRNAITVLIASVAAYNLESNGSSPFILSGKVAAGLPEVSIPAFSSRVGNQTYTFFDMCAHYGSGIFVVPLVAVLANVAIAKAFASGGPVDASQEMRTLGLCNIFGSMFSSMPTCGAFTRSAVSSASGVQTSMAGVYSGIMTLLALSFLTPYFYYIPRATLAAVLISAVIFMIDWQIVTLLWTGCKKDALVALTTFLVCIIWSVEIGLLLGAIISLVFLVHPSARPKMEMIRCKTDLGHDYLMVTVENGLSYPAVYAFCDNIVNLRRKCMKNRESIPIVLNCERITLLDYTSAKGIEKLSKEMNGEKNYLWFLHVNSDILQKLTLLIDTADLIIIDDETEINRIFCENIKIPVQPTKNSTNLICGTTVNDKKNGNLDECGILLSNDESHKKDIELSILSQSN